MAGQTLSALPPSAVRLIGSGQVITSIYSVVKELVENSVDAGATSLEVKLEDFGLEKVEVCDNGRGIKAVDASYMAKRHYTSKLNGADDLLKLTTYGFRGEALASLCAVSEVTVTTKTEEDDVSHIYILDMEGNVQGKKPSHLGTGTTVTARNLFRNLPVRKQVYRSSQRKKDDLKRIEDLLMAFGIIKPHLRITLKHGKELVWQKFQLSDTKGVLQAVLGRQVVNQLLYKQRTMEEPQGTVCAYLPKPGSDVKLMSRSAADRTFISVNDRPVQVKELVKVLKRYYDNCHACDAVRHPVCYVSVRVPPSAVDVNVDPNKTTVFLQHLNEIRTCLEEILLEIYGPLDNVPSWHYSEAVQATPEKDVTRENGHRHIEMHKKRSEGGKSKITSNNYENIENDENIVVSSNLSDSVNSPGRETCADHHNSGQAALPSFSLTFHSGKNTCNKALETASESAVPHSHKTGGNIDPLGEVEGTVNKNHTESFEVTNVPSESDNNNEICLEDLSSQAFFKDLIVEETVVGTCSTSGRVQPQTVDPTCSKDFSSNGNSNDSSVIKITSDIHNGALSDKTMNESEGAKSDTSFIDLTKNVASNDAAESTNSAQGGNSWSMGHSLVDTSGKQLQPVQLLPPSSKHTPGKRPLSPTSEQGTECPPKRKQVSTEALPANQSTLFDVFSNQQARKPSSVFEYFCDQRRSLVRETNPDESEDAIEEKLKECWDGLSSEEKIRFRDKFWQEAKRCEKQALPATNVKKSKEIKSLKGSVRDEVASVSEQSQAAAKQKKILRRRLYHSEKKIVCDVKEFRTAVEKEAEMDRIHFDKPVVIGQAESCDAWLCGYMDALWMVNVHRLGETTLYTKLMERHRFSATPCENPLVLDSRCLKEDVLVTLEDLAYQSQTKDTYFNVTDERLTANGFDIRCHRDSEGRLIAELVGLCDLIPAYNISDLSEVLHVIKKDPSAGLSDVRPVKVSYYLQGEAARMVQQSLGKKSRADVQQTLDQLSLEPQGAQSVHCIHLRPIFHKVFDLKKIRSCTAAVEEDSSDNC